MGEHEINNGPLLYAFMLYIRDRNHRVEMTDDEVLGVVNEWMDVAEESGTEEDS